MSKESIIIPISDEQKIRLIQLFNSLEDGGMLLAQVYPDGIRVKQYGKDKASKIAELLAPGKEPTYRRLLSDEPEKRAVSDE